MPTPLFTFRLAKDRAERLHEVAKVYGAPSTSELLREMVGTIVSGDPKVVADFFARLQRKMGEQLQLDFNAAVAAKVAAAKASSKRRKGGRLRAKPRR